MEGLLKIQTRNEKPVSTGKYLVEYEGTLRTVNFNAKLGFYINHPGTWWRDPQKLRIKPRAWYKKVIITEYVSV